MEKITKEEYFNKIDGLQEKYKNLNKELKEDYKKMKEYLKSSYKHGKENNDDEYNLKIKQYKQQYYKDRHDIIYNYTYD